VLADKLGKQAALVLLRRFPRHVRRDDGDAIDAAGLEPAVAGGVFPDGFFNVVDGVGPSETRHQMLGPLVHEIPTEMGKAQYRRALERQPSVRRGCFRCGGRAGVGCAAN